LHGTPAPPIVISLPALPIVEVLPALRDALRLRACVVLEAPPGAGKSTVVPLALLDEPWLVGRKLVMLQPRRIAARAVASRMSQLAGVEVGGLIGFRTRLESKVSAATRVEVVTEGILARMLQHDAALEGVGGVIFDEFHERNLQSDLGLALALDSQRHLRDDLRLIVMSATLDGESLAQLLGDAPIVRSVGRLFDVDTHYSAAAPAQASRYPDPIEKRAASVTLRALEAHEGDALVFLPGAAEIRRAIETISAATPQDVRVWPLYGDLGAADQDAALRPGPAGTRKVVVATNIAETSLTIDGVRIVIDAGLERRQRFDPASGMSRLETLRISRASADQRRGRAGRTAPGVCYRLWSESQQLALVPQSVAEILEADLAPLALDLACWGAPDATGLAWLDPPPAATLGQARELLQRLEALDARGQVTEAGRRMARLGVHPRLAHMILRGTQLGLGGLACEMAALLAERDPLRSSGNVRDPDLRHRLDVLHGAPPPPGLGVDHGALQRMKRVTQQIERQASRVAGTADPQAPRLTSDDAAGLLLAFAYPDRIGQSRSPESGRYLFSGGRGGALPGPSALARSEFVVAADLDAGEREARIFLAAPLTRVLLEQHLGHLVEDVEETAWDARTQAVVAHRVRKLDALVLDDVPLRNVPAEATRGAMIEGIRQLGLAALPWTRELEQWRARVALLRASLPPEQAAEWPDVTDAGLLATLDDWLAPWLDGITRKDHLGRLDLRGALHGQLDWNRQRQLDEWMPTHLAVPSGSRIAIDYSGGVPKLAVRLQEVFGLVESPRVAKGRVAVTMELLSPARRPVQVTQDLASFWARTYQDVKKELKGRYPKHYWPDDPYSAEATRKVRPPGER
jgi:ATP-dependent helicase HrpB